MTRPMQPLIKDDSKDRCIRFKKNAIVDWLVDRASAGVKTDLNDIAGYAAQLRVSQADREQFAQLIGYSLAGYHELSYVSDESALAASEQARKQFGKDVGGCRDKACPYHLGVYTENESDAKP